MRVWRVICVVSAFAASARANPVVLLPNAIGSQQQVTIAGRVLKAPPSQGSSTLSKNLRRVLASNAQDLTVQVEWAGEKREVQSGHDGEFSVTFSAKEGAPYAVGSAPVVARVGVEQVSAQVQIVDARAAFFVISDFDDTLAVTEVVDRRKMVDNALLKDEATQAPVAGMPSFMQCLVNSGTERHPVALVSGSPSQFVYRVRRFLFTRGFPPMGEYLRNLGPDTLSDYKQPIIRSLMKSLPNSVVLVGDSGEHDPEIYRQMRAEFPTRVRAIFIHDAGHAEDPARFEGMTLFAEVSTAAKAALAAGLISAECAGGVK